MKNGFFRFIAGVVLGYCLVQGVTFLNANYLWALFYRS